MCVCTRQDGMRTSHTNAVHYTGPEGSIFIDSLHVITRRHVCRYKYVNGFRAFDFLLSYAKLIKIFWKHSNVPGVVQE